MRVEAALFARERLRKLIDINLGLLILDSCFNTALTQKLLTDALNGSTPYYSHEGDLLNRTKIVGLVGDFTSHIAVTVRK